MTQVLDKLQPWIAAVEQRTQGGPRWLQDVRDKVEVIPTIKRADVELVFDPPWNQSMMSEAARLQTGMM